MNAIRRLLAGVRWLTFMALLSLPCGSATADETLLDTLKAAHESWLVETEFRSTYEYLSGSGKSIDDYLSGRITAPVLAERGEFHKRRGAIRHTKRFPTSPRDDSPQRNGSQVSFVPRDSVCGSELQIELFDRPDRHAAAVAIVTEAPRKYGSAPVQGSWMSNAFGPLCLWGGIYRDPFDIFPDTGQNASLSRDARPVDATHVEVIVRGEDAVRTHYKRLVFWTDPAPPVIIEVEMSETRIGADLPSFRSVARASEFVDCPGGKVARIVRSAFVHDGKVIGSEWRSKDLGVRPPSDSDFMVVVPHYARVAGVNNPPPTGNVRRIPLDMFKVSDLKVPRDPEPLLAPTGFPSRFARPLWGLLAVLGLVLIACGVVALRAWRSR